MLTKQRREARDPYRLGEAPATPPATGTNGSYFRTNPFPMPDLLSISEFAGMTQLSLPAAKRFIFERLPDYAVLRLGRELRIHSWAVAHVLKMAEQCPGCGRPWELD